MKQRSVLTDFKTVHTESTTKMINPLSAAPARPAGQVRPVIAADYSVYLRWQPSLWTIVYTGAFHWLSSPWPKNFWNQGGHESLAVSVLADVTKKGSVSGYLFHSFEYENDWSTDNVHKLFTLVTFNSWVIP